MTASLVLGHVALRHGILPSELFKEILPELRAVPFELDGHNRSQAPFHAFWIDDRNDPLNGTHFLKLCNTPEARRRGQTDFVCQCFVRQIGILLQVCQNSVVDSIEFVAHA